MNKKIIMIIIITIVITGLIIIIQTRNKKIEYTIPKVYFEGDISNMNSKEDVRDIKIKYLSSDKNFESYAKIKIQGTSSIAFEKKNYTINMYLDNKFEEKKKVDLGWGEQSKYCLKANWIDKTHARNIVTANLASDINKKYNILNNTPNNGVIDGYPVEIYINGEFLGLYTWNIPKDAWMFNMDEANDNHIVFGNESWEDASLFKSEAYYGAFGIEVGIGTAEELEKLNRLIDFINNSSNKNFKDNISEYLHLDSLINYFIMAEFAGLVDNVAKNMLLATYDGKVWYPILYDLDTSWGTMYDGLSTIKYEENTNLSLSKLWKRLEENFANEISKRYFELRKDILTKENIMNKFNDFKNLIPSETFDKENKRWSNIPGYEYNQIEEYLDVRIPLIDKIMENRNK